MTKQREREREREALCPRGENRKKERKKKREAFCSPIENEKNARRVFFFPPFAFSLSPSLPSPAVVDQTKKKAKQSWCVLAPTSPSRPLFAPPDDASMSPGHAGRRIGPRTRMRVPAAGGRGGAMRERAEAAAAAALLLLSRSPPPLPLGAEASSRFSSPPTQRARRADGICARDWHKQLLDAATATAFYCFERRPIERKRKLSRSERLLTFNPNQNLFSFSLFHHLPPATQNKKQNAAEANPRDQGLPPHGPPQGRSRRPRQEGRQRRDQVQGPLLAPPLHARRRRRREGEQAEAVAAPGARRARQPLNETRGENNSHSTFKKFLRRCKRNIFCLRFLSFLSSFFVFFFFSPTVTREFLLPRKVAVRTFSAQILAFKTGRRRRASLYYNWKRKREREREAAKGQFSQWEKRERKISLFLSFFFYPPPLPRKRKEKENSFHFNEGPAPRSPPSERPRRAPEPSPPRPRGRP